MVWLVVTGIFKIVGGLSLPKGDGSKGLLVVNGVLALIIGVLLLSFPLLEGLLAMVILIAFFGIFSGIMLISLRYWKIHRLNFRIARSPIRLTRGIFCS